MRAGLRKACNPTPTDLHAVDQPLQPDLDVALGIHCPLKLDALSLRRERQGKRGMHQVKTEAGLWKQR